jgi:major membrane immunogen (membrane-anchored lipoprotein)
MKFVTALLLAAACSVGVAQANVPIGGKYKVEGTNFDGTKYSGDATITITSETTCAIEWQTGADSSSVGICMRNDDSFAAAYKMKDGSVGLIIYKVAKDGSMDGIWTLTGKDGAGTEVLTPDN